MAHFSPPSTRAPAGHLLAKPSQRPRLRLVVLEEALWTIAEVGKGKEECLGGQKRLTYTNSLKMIVLGISVTAPWRPDLVI